MRHLPLFALFLLLVPTAFTGAQKPRGLPPRPPVSSSEAEQTGGESGTQKEGMWTPQAWRQILENTPALYKKSRFLSHKGKMGRNSRPAAPMEGGAFWAGEVSVSSGPEGRSRVSNSEVGSLLPLLCSPRARPPKLAREPCSVSEVREGVWNKEGVTSRLPSVPEFWDSSSYRRSHLDPALGKIIRTPNNAPCWPRRILLTLQSVHFVSLQRDLRRNIPKFLHFSSFSSSTPPSSSLSSSSPSAYLRRVLV